MVKIYTRKGDDGATSLFDGTRVSKAHVRVGAYGDVDELNSTLGIARASLSAASAPSLDGCLQRVQRELFALGALLADPRPREPEAEDAGRLAVHEGLVTQLEREIDAWERGLEPLRAFILPAGSIGAASLHLARTVARRAERSVTPLVETSEVPAIVGRYLNRLSDWLFVAARHANALEGVADTPW